MSTQVLPAQITAGDLHEALFDGGELAILDVREPAVTAADGSLLWAVSAPLSRLELTIERLVPRRATRIVTIDSDGADSLAERAAARLRELGYSDVRALAGGVSGWGDAGFKVQTGSTHVLGQAFGEFVEDTYGTPHISVSELRDKLAAGEDVVLLDSRPRTEFEVHSLPGGISIPGAELVYRAAGVIPSPEALVVVNCAGRTRSILGAQTLINAGIENEVVALEGGTMSWLLADLELDHGKVHEAPAPGPHGLDQAKRAAAQIAERFDVRGIGRAELAHFAAESEQRTLYLLDVRTPEEYASGHRPGSYSTPSWEVAPWVFRHVATRNARLVLVDDPDLVRATVAASWLIQIGWGEVFVLRDGLNGVELETGAEPPRRELAGDALDGIELVEPVELAELLDAAEPPLVIDLQPSPRYREAHIPGARFASRTRLAALIDKLPGSGLIVVSSDDDLLSALTARELAAITNRPVSMLRGGIDGWAEAGLAVEDGDGQLLHAPDDVARNAWQLEDPEEQKQGFRDYLSWEVSLVAELQADSTARFRVYPA
jgi:rhodanese-related sulfurtransferase